MMKTERLHLVKSLLFSRCRRRMPSHFSFDGGTKNSLPQRLAPPPIARIPLFSSP